MTPISTPSNRLLELDALRGLAALGVVLFHFTTRFEELFRPGSPSSLWFPHGHFGVNLFFIISGFVIFMTLEKTSAPMDFVVSRFSRLFPAYWVAIFLTLSITHVLGLPGKLVSMGTAVANMTMVHGLFGVPHVDGVYWTLEVELLFYAGMLLLYRFSAMAHLHQVIGGLLVLRLTYHFAEAYAGVSLPWTVYRLLILQHLPWFALGISVYLFAHRKGAAALRQPFQTAILAIATLWICESVWLAGLALLLALAVFLASTHRLPLLRLRPLVWLGTISYPLYLLHENIGWAVLLRLRALHMPLDLAILVALCISLFLANVITRWVEQPALRWLRGRYAARLQVRALGTVA